MWEHPGPAWSPPHTPSVYSRAAPPSSSGRWWQLGGGSAQTCAEILFAQNIAMMSATCLWSPPTVCWPGGRSSAGPSPGDRTSTPGTLWTRSWNTSIEKDFTSKYSFTRHWINGSSLVLTAPTPPHAVSALSNFWADGSVLVDNADPWQGWDLNSSNL